MSRSRLKAKGRRGGEAERFAYLPESVLTSPAVATMPHAALRVLCALVAGQSRERNGLQMCSNSYAARFGITSATTLHASLETLRVRGLITKTWEVGRLARTPARYAVTWWPILYRNGQPLAQAEPASHAYAEWQPDSPANGLNGRTRNEHGRFSSLQPLEKDSPANGLNDAAHQSSGWSENGVHQSTGWRHSRSRTGGTDSLRLAELRLADALALARSNPAIEADDLAARCRIDLPSAHRVLQQLQAGAAP